MRCDLVYEYPKLYITFAENVKRWNSFHVAVISSVDPTHLQEPCQPKQSCPGLPSFDLVLNNRLWSASQIFLLLWGASKASSYKATVLHFFNNTQTGESSFPAHVSALAVAVCTAGMSEVCTVTLGDSNRRREKNPDHFHVRKMYWEKEPQALLCVIFYVWILSLLCCKQNLHFSSVWGERYVYVVNVYILIYEVCVWWRRRG